MLDSEVVLTKIKCLRNFQERWHATDHCGCNAPKAAELLHAEASDNASAIFPESQLTRLYKFESEDSGVELPSGANSPSTPTGSEQSFALCESPCHSEELAASSQEPQQVDPIDESVMPDVEDDSPATSEELDSSTLTEGRSGEDGGGDTTSGGGDGGDGGECEVSEARLFGEQLPGLGHDSTATDKQCEDMRGSGDEQSLEEYMDQCCRLSEVSRQTSPLSR